MQKIRAGDLDVFGQYFAGGVNGTPGLFAAKLDPDGSTVIYSTDLGASADAKIAGIVLDTSGNAYLAGTNSSAQFPALAGVPDLGGDFVLQLDSTGKTAKTLFRFLTGTISMPPVFNAGGELLLGGAQGSLLSMPVTYAFDTPAIAGYANAASLAVNTGLYPGELVAVFGWGLGNVQQVMVGGVAATVLYSSSTQINLQVPFDVNYTQNQIAVAMGSATIQAVQAQSLGLFTTDGIHAAAVNEDGTVNSASNPAAGGSIVTLFGTGAIWPAGIVDGAVANTAMMLDQEANRFQVVDGSGTPVSILYAGTAPGLIEGVFQLNLQLPADVRIPLTLVVGENLGLASNGVQVYLK